MALQQLGPLVVNVALWLTDPPDRRGERHERATWEAIADEAAGCYQSARRAARRSTIGWERTILTTMADKWYKQEKHARNAVERLDRLSGA